MRGENSGVTAVVAAAQQTVQLSGDLGLPASISWRRSSRCGTHGSCVEVADLADGQVAVRDGKIPATSPILVFTAAEWHAFVAGVMAGDFS